MSILPVNNLASLMDQITYSLDRLDEQSHRLQEGRVQSEINEKRYEDKLQKKIDEITKRIAVLELQLASIQNDVQSPSAFIKKYDLARGEDISRLARLSATFIIGCVEHTHDVEDPRPRYLPTEQRGSRFTKTAKSLSDKPAGYCVHHHNDGKYVRHMGYPGPLDERKLWILGYKFEPPYYKKIEQ